MVISTKVLITIAVLSCIWVGALVIYYNWDFILQKPLFVSPVTSARYSGIPEVKKLMVEFGVPYSSVSIVPDGTIQLKLVNNEEILLSEKKDLREQVSSLQRILSRLTIEGKRFTRLDFRFDKPLVISSGK